MNRRIAACFFIALAAGCVSAAAQQHETEHTLKFSATDRQPRGTLQDVAWMEGVWEGSAFGGLSEEIWSKPNSGTMMGVYRSIEKGRVTFYEIDLIVETKGSIEMRLKHFNPDLKGWEEKDEVRVFPLVKLDPDTIYFDGMTYKRTGPDSVTVYLAISEKGSTKSREVVFDYHRQKRQGEARATTE